MSNGGAGEVARIGAAVSGVVERVFATVARVHDAALHSVERERLQAGRAVLPAGTRELLREPGQLAVGLGLVVAPRADLGLPQRLEWW